MGHIFVAEGLQLISARLVTTLVKAIGIYYTFLRRTRLPLNTQSKHYMGYTTICSKTRRIGKSAWRHAASSPMRQCRSRMRLAGTTFAALCALHGQPLTPSVSRVSSSMPGAFLYRRGCHNSLSQLRPVREPMFAGVCGCETCLPSSRVSCPRNEEPPCQVVFAVLSLWTSPST